VKKIKTQVKNLRKKGELEKLWGHFYYTYSARPFVGLPSISMDYILSDFVAPLLISRLKLLPAF